MTRASDRATTREKHINPESHEASDYFAVLTELVHRRQIATEKELERLQQAIDDIYIQLKNEILTNTQPPVHEVKFGTSGWRGILGKDLFVQSVATVTCAILQLFKQGEQEHEIGKALGNISFADMQRQGCVVGFDNRFGGDLLALAVVNVLAANGVKVYYAGEATTGALSAAVLVRNAAFSINLTPSHNPMQYGGVKFNAADGGPAAPVLTNFITRCAGQYLKAGHNPFLPGSQNLQKPLAELPEVITEDALKSWQKIVRENQPFHGIDYDGLIEKLATYTDLVICVDAVHGASRDYIARLLGNPPEERLILLRNNPDPTFNGIAPEPSSANMVPTFEALLKREEPLKIGAIIDPDGDRVRFTDGEVEISMNQFGAMAYHFIHEVKKKKGMVAKTVATSNLANGVAARLGEEVFESRVGFKEFKPVIGRALVFFEESDGLSIIGHTPEKDAFIGLILAIDMVITLGVPLGTYLKQIEEEFGYYYPDRGGLPVRQSGDELITSLRQLEKYREGETVTVNEQSKTIEQVISIDGRKMIFEDGSWIMIRPSGTEPKVRYYVEARDPKDTAHLVKIAHSMLAETGVLP